LIRKQIEIKMAALCGGTGEEKEATEEVQLLVNNLREDIEKKAGLETPAEEFKAVKYKTQVKVFSFYLQI